MLYRGDIDRVLTVKIVVLMIVDLFIREELMMSLNWQLVTVAFN